MKRVLITGATGFVGSHVLEALMQAPDIEPVAACRDPARVLPAFEGEVRVGDLRRSADRKRLLADIDMVCHAAAWSSLWGNAEASKQLYLEPSLALLEDAVQAGVQRFIFVSSTSAAAPGAADAFKPGIERSLWPHLCNVIRIEDRMRVLSDQGTTMVNLRCGLFAGNRYALGLLPILLPRLKTHLVPWIRGGRTGMPIIDGTDIGRAFGCAVQAAGLAGYESFNIVGPEVPRAREVIDFLHAEFGYPRPHFSVPFPVGYAFAWLMEKLDPVVPWEPLVVRSVIHLLEETGATNEQAEKRLGYVPGVSWREAIRKQVAEMARRNEPPMSMVRPLEV